MKKSNALMLSYVIFLIISIIASCFFSWNELDKIAMAATVAGLFFAIADLINWYFSYQKEVRMSFLNSEKEVLEAVNMALSLVEKRERESNEVITLTAPYVDKRESLKSESLEISKRQNGLQNAAERLSEAKEEMESVYRFSNRMSKKIDKRKDIEIVFLILGFISFFVTVVFNDVFALLLNIESYLTVIAFGIIMATYYAKEFIKNKYEKDHEMFIKTAKWAKEIMEKDLQDETNENTINEIKNTIADIESIEKLLPTTEESLIGEQNNV